MATVVSVMDGNGWAGNTDVIVVADPVRRSMCWVPRDLWCGDLNDRINAAYGRGGHRALIAALGEHGIVVQHSVCLRRAATERACRSLEVTVPVERELAFWYPLAPREPIEQGRRLIRFRPPRERLSGERIHQWVGARYSVRADATDLDRIRRQQILVRELLAQGHDFGRAVADPALVDWSSPGARAELASVAGSWRYDALGDVVDATIDGKRVLLERGRRGQLRRGVAILAYHRIGQVRAAGPADGHTVSRTMFADQLAELARRGWSGVTQHALLDGWNAEHELPARPLVIGFDGGHASVWREALPLMAARGWPGVLNLAPGSTGSEDALTDSMVRELVDAGWDLGVLADPGPDPVRPASATPLQDELRRAREALEDTFDICVDFVCGTVETASGFADAARGAGYLGATTMRPGLAQPGDPWALARVRVDGADTGQTLADRLDELSATVPSRAG